MVAAPGYDAACAESAAANELAWKEHAHLAALLGLVPADIICLEHEVLAHPDWYRNGSERVLLYQDSTGVEQPE